MIHPGSEFALDLATPTTRSSSKKKGGGGEEEIRFINAADFWTKDRTRLPPLAEKGDPLRAWTLFVRELQEREVQSAGSNRPMTSPLMSGKARLLWPSLLLRRATFVPLLRVSPFLDYFQRGYAFPTKYLAIRKLPLSSSISQIRKDYSFSVKENWRKFNPTTDHGIVMESVQSPFYIMKKINKFEE